MAVSFRPFETDPMPKFRPLKVADLQNIGVNYDEEAYRLSDADFRARHKPLLRAEKLFERSVLADQKGESELMPAIRNEFVRAGMTDALTAFGDSPGTLKPGSAGEASVARNLGLSIVGFQDRNRANRQRSLALAESLFPRRTFGLTGADAVAMNVANTAGQNNWSQAEWATGVQLDQLNWNSRAQADNAGVMQGNADAAASAQKQQAAVQAGTAILSAAVMAAAMSCHVAREVFGVHSNEWRIFRKWMLCDSPDWFRNLYLRHAECVAKMIRPFKSIKSILRGLMGLVVKAQRRQWL